MKLQEVRRTLLAFGRTMHEQRQPAKGCVGSMCAMMANSGLLHPLVRQPTHWWYTTHRIPVEACLGAVVPGTRWFLMVLLVTSPPLALTLLLDIEIVLPFCTHISIALFSSCRLTPALFCLPLACSSSPQVPASLHSQAFMATKSCRSCACRCFLALRLLS